MTVAEYIFDFLQKKGISTVFMISGSSAMWLTDALKRNENLKAICNQHEQVCVMSADIYGRLNDIPGVALVTIGPGATNAITGVAGAWTDSSPLIVLSGNASSKLLKYEQDTAIRQHGTQSLDLSNIVSHITKYFAVIMQPEETRYHVERAYFEAMEGRRGPVWLDIPVDIQNKQIPENMERFSPPATNYETIDISTINKLISNSKKPLILAGGGATQNEITTLSHALSIPVVTSRMGIGNIISSDPFFIGRPGAYGDRASHFAIQQCDLLLILGCRLSISTIGYYPDRFGGNAVKVQVDVDRKELAKTDIPIDYKIHTTIDEFVKAVKDIKIDLSEHKKWIEHCSAMRAKYPVVLEEYKLRKPLNAYWFTQILSELTPENTIITVDTGSVSNIVSQSWNLKKGQRYFISGGLACMGFWAGTIGCINKPAIALTGDGACAMNIQEFATLKYYNLPIKVFVYQNKGYMLIRHNQHNYMNDRFLGVGPDSGVQTPNYCKVAEAFGLPAVCINADDDIQKRIKEVLATKGPVICEVILEEFGELAPRIASRVMPDGSLKACEFDDLFPFLEKE
ncbi:MAG: thiamine pyrophosphate-binding protein [Rickettsiales bacterium]|jgi:acetolactate synthase-1/2/3 large subunit|nr:thiamine pyrophosphate-binding protein [Rickettsiales bacterium]